MAPADCQRQAVCGLVMPHAISWLADNAQKGVSIRPSVTIHASPAFTREHYDRDRDEVAALLLEAAAEWINAEVVGYSVQRWRYSIPTAGVEARCLLDQTRGNIVFAGDAFGGARVEGAALSGLAAATALLSTEQ